MRIEETTFSLNITILGATSSEAKVQVEQISPMGKEEFWNWLISAAKAQELPKTTRPSREVWRDTRESPQPRTKIKEMDEYALQYKKFKRKFPQASPELLAQKTKEFLDARKNILSDFTDILSQSLFFEKPKGQESIMENPKRVEPSSPQKHQEQEHPEQGEASLHEKPLFSLIKF